MKETNQWLNDYDEIVVFGSVLLDTMFDHRAADLQYYYEKPWKWTREHESWVLAGRPVEGDELTDWAQGCAGFEALR